MKYTILHISDIHKSPSMQYDSLLQSLERDLNHYTQDESIEKPTFIVISGDIIQGANDDNTIRLQYCELEGFLSKLCTLFLEGKRQNLIMVPGNHDVNRSRTRASMRTSTEPNDICRKYYFNGSSSVRWNWEDFKFYDIVDLTTYDTRFELFVEFYNRFFKGIRQYPTDPVRKAYCVRNDKYKVTFACFNSCHNLDHLCFTGCIPEEAIVSVGEELINSNNSGYLNIAVWHHHFYGSPLESNYIDRGFLNYLLEYNVHLGLFGHQHHSQIAEEYSDLQLYKEDQLQKLLLVSSGTLFGGDKELAYGVRRQYNLIEVEHSNGSAKVSINIREDINPTRNSLIPIWHCHPLNNDNNKITRTLKLNKLSGDKLLRKIDKQVREDGDYISAYERVIDLEIDEKQKRTILLEYLRNVTDYEYVYKTLGNVQSIEEAMLKIFAVTKLDDVSKKQEILDDPFIKATNDSNVRQMLSGL